MASQTVSRIVITGTVLAVAAIGIVGAAGIGSRLGWWNFRAGFSLLRYGAIIALTALPVLGLGVFVTRPGRGRRGFGIALAAIALTLVTAAIPLSWMYTARQVPAIHDISTDPMNPPSLVALLALRGEGSNPVPGRLTETAALQHEAYPDIVPLVIKLSADNAFDRALTVARSMDWEIVSADKSAGRIEATDTTFWFGFKDDIVVRLAPQPDGTRIDVRSISRVGRSDVGTNARRIRTFLGLVKQQASG